MLLLLGAAGEIVDASVAHSIVFMARGTKQLP
jgi:hypothetical protein